jgi:hypothetical protein
MILVSSVAYQVVHSTVIATILSSVSFLMVSSVYEISVAASSLSPWMVLVVVWVMVMVIWTILTLISSSNLAISLVIMI